MYKKIIKVIIFCLILTGCVFSLEKSQSLENSNLVEKVETEICEIVKINKIIEGNSMSPLLQNGQGIVLLENYYKCGYSVQKGDLVAYHYGGNAHPLIKKVRISAEDEVEIVDNQLQVNGEILKNSIEQEYRFSDAEVQMMKLYLREKHIPQNTFFLFGDNLNDSIDSRKFGAVSSKDFLGKFDFTEE